MGRGKKAGTHLQSGPICRWGPEPTQSTGTNSQVGLSALWPFYSGPNLYTQLCLLTLFISSYGWSEGPPSSAFPWPPAIFSHSFLPPSFSAQLVSRLAAAGTGSVPLKVVLRADSIPQAPPFTPGAAGSAPSHTQDPLVSERVKSVRGDGRKPSHPEPRLR